MKKVLLLLSLFGIALSAGAVFGQEWVPSGLSDAAVRGLKAGNEADGTPVFIIRSPFQGGQTLGKFIPKNHAAYVPWGGKENPVTVFELYVGSGRWQPLTLGAPLPPDAVAGGKEADGSPLYIIRAFSGKALVPGKYSAGTGKAYIPWAGKEVEVTKFEILVRDAPPPRGPDWIPADTGSNAAAARPAGVSPDGTPSFLIRAPFQGGVTPGKYNPKAKSAYVPWGGKENPVKTFELYVGPGHWVTGAGVPADAVKAGSEADGTPLLAIRSQSGKALVPGKYNVNTNTAYISLGGKEVVVTQYDFLVDAPMQPAPATMAPPPPPPANPMNGDDPMLTDLRTAAMTKTALVVKPVVVAGGLLSVNGELTAKDYLWNGMAVDAYALSFDSGATFYASFSAMNAQSDDLRVILLDPQGDPEGVIRPTNTGTYINGRAPMPGTYTLLVVQLTDKGRTRYGGTIQETDFTLEGNLKDGVSVVPMAWATVFPFWDFHMTADFVPLFDLLDGQGKVLARSEATGGDDSSAEKSFTPQIRGMGSVKITPRFPTTNGHWRLNVKLSAGS